MSVGYLIIGIALGVVAMLASLTAGATGGGALMAYMLGGSLAVMLTATRAALHPTNAPH